MRRTVRGNFAGLPSVTRRSPSAAALLTLPAKKVARIVTLDLVPRGRASDARVATVAGFSSGGSVRMALRWNVALFAVLGMMSVNIVHNSAISVLDANSNSSADERHVRKNKRMSCCTPPAPRPTGSLPLFVLALAEERPEIEPIGGRANGGVKRPAPV